MKLQKLFIDDDAVSPVIGVILMVAITVILAAVIGAFVLGFGGGGPSAPSVQWESTHNSSGHVIFEHNGGDTIDNANNVLSVTGTGLTGSTLAPPTMNTGSTVDRSNGTTALNGEYTLVWEPEDGDSSQELATHNV